MIHESSRRGLNLLQDILLGKFHCMLGGVFDADFGAVFLVPPPWVHISNGELAESPNMIMSMGWESSYAQEQGSVQMPWVVASPGLQWIDRMPLITLLCARELFDSGFSSWDWCFTCLSSAVSSQVWQAEGIHGLSWQVQEDERESWTVSNPAFFAL